MSEDRINVHIGGLDDMGRRFIDAWHAVEAAQSVERDNVTFLTLEAFLAAMSPKRLELMRHLRREGPMSVRRLSQQLLRDRIGGWCVLVRGGYGHGVASRAVCR